jgi:hypothetical protein
MGLKRTKLQAVNAVTGITTVGIFTVGVTNTGGPVGVASTTYVRGVIMHNTGLASTINSLATPIFEVSRNGRKIYWQSTSHNNTSRRTPFRIL